MKYEDQGAEHLLDELAKLRHRIEELEALKGHDKKAREEARVKTRREMHRKGEKCLLLLIQPKMLL